MKQAIEKPILDLDTFITTVITTIRRWPFEVLDEESFYAVLIVDTHGNLRFRKTWAAEA